MYERTNLRIATETRPTRNNFIQKLFDAIDSLWNYSPIRSVIEDMKPKRLKSVSDTLEVQILTIGLAQSVSPPRPNQSYP
jgi:hypothetical protein